ncbi:hypothetical protein V2I01_28015 [Micromonospora sp. BRA006-A]|nr:hypothetical protein [Micromonospora sp. BRA006-A]
MQRFVAGSCGASSARRHHRRHRGRGGGGRADDPAVLLVPAHPEPRHRPGRRRRAAEMARRFLVPMLERGSQAE